MYAMSMIIEEKCEQVLVKWFLKYRKCAVIKILKLAIHVYCPA